MKSEFVERVALYSRLQPAGDKHHFRATDRLAGTCSPMVLYGVPVSRMFYQPNVAGAPLNGPTMLEVIQPP